MEPSSRRLRHSAQARAVPNPTELRHHNPGIGLPWNVIVRTLLPATLLVLLWSAAGSPLAHAAGSRSAPAEVERGEYLVNLLACGRCHTEGYLTGQQATGPYLAGSTIGIAYSGYEGENERPGLVFARNLTPDPDTGIGSWSRDDLVRALRSGISKDGHQNLPVMPSANYATLEERDLYAIAAYLKSIPPVERRIPARTVAGTPPEHPYVRFGIYLFEPSGAVEERPVP
jgi:cytochrome c553